jgi:hypothetical protein
VQLRLRSILSFTDRDASTSSGLAVMTAVAAALVVGLAVGCGSSNSSSTASTAALSKPAFLAKANAICKQGSQKQQAAQGALGKEPSQAQVTTYVSNSFAPNVQAQIDGVRALGAPSGDQATVTNMLDIAQADLDKVKSNPALLTGNTDQFANFAKLAHPYGLTACAPNS